MTPVNLKEGIKYNSAMVKSVNPHPNREAFFARLDDERIDQLITEYCGDKLHVRLKMAFMHRARCMLERLGLLDEARGMLLKR